MVHRHFFNFIAPGSRPFHISLRDGLDEVRVPAGAPQDRMQKVLEILHSNEITTNKSTYNQTLGFLCFLCLKIVN